MAYRKTPLVKANAKAKREAIIQATIGAIAREGLHGLTTDQIAEKAEVSAGLLYRYFPDRNEMIAIAMAQILAEHTAAIRASESFADGPIDLVAAIIVLYDFFKEPPLVSALFATPLYREGIRDELAGIIKRAALLSSKERKTAAAATLGILEAIHGEFGSGPKAASIAVAFSLRAIGVPNAAINRAIDRFSMQA